MADARRQGCCCCCFRIILTVGSSLLLTFLFLRPKRPTCSIEDFYVPALNKSSNSTTNHTIFFDLKLDNPNALKGLYYTPLNLSFSYGPNNASISVANHVAPGFYQGFNKKTHRREVVETRGVPWAAVLNGSMRPVFRVDLVTAVKIKNILWKSKSRKVVVGADVEVNDAGRKVNEKGIRLIKAGAPGVCCYPAPVLPLVVSSFLVLII